MGDRSRGWRSEKHQVQEDQRRLMQMPKEIVMNILSRICWKILLKSVRYVCKKWYFLIQHNDDFAHLHMKRTRISSSSFELAAISYEKSPSLFHTNIFSILTSDGDNNNFVSWRHFDGVRNSIPVDGELSIDYNFIGSVNGLISLHKVNTNTALVFNPLTKQMVTLPQNKSYKLPGPSWSSKPNGEYGVDSGWLSATGFWFCGVNKEYKLVHVYFLDPMMLQHHDHVIEVEIISLGLDHRWRKPKGGRPNKVPVGNAVVLGNVMYWLGYPVRPTYMGGATSCVTEIVWFDVCSEEFGTLKCPNLDDNVCYNQRLLVGVDGLCLVSHCVPRWDIKSRYGNIELVVWTLKHPIINPIIVQQKWVQQECRYFSANRQLQDRVSGALCITRNAYVVHYYCEIEKCWGIVLKKGNENDSRIVVHTNLAVVPYQTSLVSPPSTPLPTPI